VQVLDGRRCGCACVAGTKPSAIVPAALSAIQPLGWRAITTMKPEAMIQAGLM